ncbi:tripartite tricarboxylate transporter substrate binding protein [Ramlibacter sp. G-1-2-2]|uniref:Tripartite tricarboxylate transporter substrate binding protein n=1 Tax=Ramlibacter agri TaxID=2728837 RepID=A0A848HB58_9BURK|nr:tripartite tricarboxylate transporter substrate binding protein [Ramlibacter agri]NML46720.1 tripartite tricarboxylate transporter substrate binding protein [Ramlibacter agri]
MKRRIVRRLAGALCAALFSLAAHAQGDPTVRIIVPFNPGGGSDLFARTVSPGLASALKRTVIVENKAGAGGVIGADAVAKAKPDGNTLLVSDFGVYSISPSLYPRLPYAAKDFQPVVELARFPNVLVVPGSSPFNNLADLLKAARKDPDTLTIASAGNGSSPHLTAEKFQRAAQIKLVHVAYKGAGPAIADTMGGQVQMMFTGLPSVSEFVASGKLKVLAIASASRSEFAPEVPTFGEAGVAGFESSISQGLFAPAGTPAATVAQINAAINQLMAGKEMAQRMQQLKVSPRQETPAQYKAWLDQEAKTWSQLIKDAAIKVE